MRLLGMLVALVVILVGFHILSGGKLINPANMVTLGVQTSGTAIMATGMVLIIVSRNIDLSVGSQVGVTAMVYAVLMTDILPNVLGIPEVGSPIHVDRRARARASGSASLIGAFQGFIIAYIGRALLRGHAGWSAGPARDRVGPLRGGRRSPASTRRSARSAAASSGRSAAR